MNIFGSEGKTIRTDEITILLYFSLIIFIINIDKASYSNLLIIISILTVALINKPTALFFIILPFLILVVKFYNEKFTLLKILLSFVIAYIFFLIYLKIKHTI